VESARGTIGHILRMKDDHHHTGQKASTLHSTISGMTEVEEEERAEVVTLVNSLGKLLHPAMMLAHLRAPHTHRGKI